jgi:hypothetical protein
LHPASPFSHVRSTVGVTSESAAVIKPIAVPARPVLQRLKIAGLLPPRVFGAGASVRFWDSAIPILGPSGILTDEEFARFSQETRSLVAALLGELTI